MKKKYLIIFSALTFAFINLIIKVDYNKDLSNLTKQNLIIMNSASAEDIPCILCGQTQVICLTDAYGDKYYGKNLGPC